MEEQDEIVACAEEHVEASAGKHVTIKEAYTLYKQQRGGVMKSKFAARLKACMTTRGITFWEQSTRGGERVNSFWDNVALVL